MAILLVIGYELTLKAGHTYYKSQQKSEWEINESLSQLCCFLVGHSN